MVKMVNGENNVFTDIDKMFAAREQRRKDRPVVSGLTKEEVQRIREEVRPREFSTTLSATQSGAAKALKRKSVERKVPQRISLKSGRKILKKLAKPAKGIFKAVTTRPKFKPRIKRLRVSLEDIARTKRTSILAPTVFSTKITQNFQKKRKPISFFGKGKI